MSIKIYREIDNNSVKSRDNNILLQFVCEVNLYDATDHFCSCMNYVDDIDDYSEVNRTHIASLRYCLEHLKKQIEYRSQNNMCDGVWFDEANRCAKILEKELDRESGFYMLFNY